MTHDTLTCIRCGKCCLATAFSFIKDEDLQRWRRENRDDILAIIEHWHPIWVGDHVMNSADGEYIRGCPFLVWEGSMSSCRIYETRPITCVNYRCGSSEICPRWRPDR